MSAISKMLELQRNSGMDMGIIMHLLSLTDDVKLCKAIAEFEETADKIGPDFSPKDRATWIILSLSGRFRPLG